eukprot:238286-Hanusia_phi.AAC.1
MRPQTCGGGRRSSDADCEEEELEQALSGVQESMDRDTRGPSKAEIMREMANLSEKIVNLSKESDAQKQQNVDQKQQI